ncbi:helix-turn-helix transcriptional regulator [Burkholderia sp. Ax-1719]|uniref:helix-turn-helix domain-containing protein n=1 Tax=Burkholderia sp. Ax-1719 TaxID=2608334 RepID=UPI00141FC013|nr:helix-turn-helix transcriptional regulator [Burkholderia sp. Ax-1719]NIE63048.1 helix-turn-helix transcriptional regulator [Burkholderia sp. Ax-1719]
MEEIDNTVADPWLRRRFAENVRRVRKERNLTQEELSELCGYHRTYMSHVERSVRTVSLDNLQRIAEALKTSPEVLLTEYVPESAPG